MTAYASFKMFALSNQIAMKIADGLTPEEALRAVCGAEAVTAMLRDLYDELRGMPAKGASMAQETPEGHE